MIPADGLSVCMLALTKESRVRQGSCRSSCQCDEVRSSLRVNRDRVHKLTRHDVDGGCLFDKQVSAGILDNGIPDLLDDGSLVKISMGRGDRFKVQLIRYGDRYDMQTPMTFSVIRTVVFQRNSHDGSLRTQEQAKDRTRSEESGMESR